MTAPESTATLMIVEDDLALQRQLKWSFEGYELVFAGDRAEAITQLRRYEPSVVLLDLGLPPDADGVEEGMSTLAEILRLAPNTKVVVVTGNGDESSALRAVAMGAYDFYQKPADMTVLGLIIERAFHIWNLEAQNRSLRTEADGALEGVIAASDAMMKVCRLVEKVGPTDATTLLLGETGSGKEVLARALHKLSPRKDERFVAINCAAIPENLLESELFGYEKGAFTGANRTNPGKVELAHQGTLFLDEIGDMPMALQAKMLRFLQERTVERIGGREEIPVDVRVICATHQKLDTLIAQGAFREDLYYRIAEISITIPPLRERDGDAVVLAKSFFEKAATKNERRLRGFSREAIAAIESHGWPGNVRELEHKINRAVIMAEDKLVTAEDMGLQHEQTEEDELPLNLRVARDDAERAAIERVMNVTEGNVSKASRLLGVSRPALYDLFRKHQIQTP